MLDAIVHNLEQSNHIARIKKLVFCACTNNWSNEAQQLSTVKFKSYLQQLRDRHASVVELKYLLYRIVIRLNHSTNYYTVANFLCQEMEPLYAYQSTGSTTESGSTDAESVSTALPSRVAVWGKEVILTVEEIQSGSVLQVEMTVLAANHQLVTQLVVTFPDLAQTIAQYQEWQARYRRLDPHNHRLMSSKAVSLVPERINDCLDAGAMLQANLHQWYSSPGFQAIRERLATTVDPDLEIEIIVRSRSKALLKLPWNSIWQPLLDRYPQAEVSVAPMPTISEAAAAEELQVSVLCLLTSAQGIKLDRSREYLNALPYTQSEFIVAPTHTDFVNAVTHKPLSVLFFSSYISGYLPNNRIYINHHDTIGITEFKYRIRTAVHRGLKLLILNCGEGLELASELADLQIPNLIVMREAVQDQVAQEFVKLFLKAFSGGKSLQLAVRDARERLQAIEKVVPAASCLPTICQQISAPASSWNRLAHIALKPTEVLEMSQSWAETEATGMIAQADLELGLPPAAIVPTIAYDRLELVHQLTGYFSEVYALALSADGQWLVSGHGDITHVDDAVKVWRLADGKLTHNLLGHSHWVYGVLLTTDAETIISGSLDGTVQWWQLATGTKLPQLLDNKSAVNAIALTSDGQRLVTGGNDALLKIWQPQNGLLIHQCQGHLQNVTCLATYSQNQLVVSGSSDYTVRLWQLQEGRLLKTLLGHSGRISSIAISPDGTKIVSASHDCTLKIWEAATGNLLDTLAGHTKSIGCVAISPDGRTIVSAGDDRTVNIWSLNDGTLLHTLSAHDRAILSMAIGADSRTIATGSYGEVQIWRVPAG
ncbi:WD40 repeat domain-containing protein [Chamaesiphon sp.]|uniref:WD40 repeat domain-containing protein n=1 Tax=Chamaesiphon sp. TaxID=2814140 RepID=UPI0035936E09